VSQAFNINDTLNLTTADLSHIEVPGGAIKFKLTPVVNGNDTTFKLEPAGIDHNLTNTSSSSSSSINKSIKIPTPKPFTGRVPVAPLTVQTFIMTMDSYMDAVQIDKTTSYSKVVAVRYLEEDALLWYTHFIKKTIVNSWEDLKQYIQERYQPAAQEQISMRNLIRIKFAGSVADYNNRFLKELQLLPSYGDASHDQIFMSMYLNGIESAPNTTYLATNVRQAINDKETGKSLTLHKLQEITLIAEMNLGRNSGAAPNKPAFNRNPYTPNPKFNRNNNNGRSNYRYNNNKFQTPARLNNMDNEDDTNGDIQDYQDDFEDDNNNGGIEDEQDYNDDENELNNVEQDDNADTEYVMLNIIKTYEKGKRFNPNFSTSQLHQHIKDKLCFNCNKPGHFARDCKAPKKQFNKPANNNIKTIQKKKTPKGQ